MSDDGSSAWRQVNARPSQDCSFVAGVSVDAASPRSSWRANSCVTTYVTRTGSTAHARSTRSSSLSATHATTTTTQQMRNMSATLLTMSVTEETRCRNTAASDCRRPVCLHAAHPPKHNTQSHIVYYICCVFLICLMFILLLVRLVAAFKTSATV